MQRSSLSISMVLVTVACGPALGDGAGDTSRDAEGAVLVTTATSKTTAVPQISSTSTTAASIIKTTPVRQPQADACVNYDSITAALGSRTIDCLGTIGPDAYGVDKNGRLVPRFDKCTQDPPVKGDDVYGDILSLLSIQLRKEAPDAARCMGGRYEAWLKSFQASGISTCPVWTRLEIVNAPSKETIRKISSTLPQNLPTSKPDKVPVIPHENYLMGLKYPEGKREQRCKDEADCAQKCSAGFPGMWIDGAGDRALIDPAYWLITIDYGANANPFMTPGYYHPMSFSGTVPGALYGHRNRRGEPCSRFVIDRHLLLSLQLDCLDPAVPTTCITVCAEPLPDTAGTASKSSY